MYNYRQSTGELRDAAGSLLGVGYAGAGAGKNNPSLQNVFNVGPLPRGQYKIQPPVDTVEHGPFVLWLTPDPANEMAGRGGFGIHGDSIAHPGTASEGCVIQVLPVRQLVAASLASDDDLEVVE